MKYTISQLYNKLVNDYQIIGQEASILFQLKDLQIKISTKDTVGNLLQEWLKAWMKAQEVDFLETGHSQSFPDFNLDTNNLKKALLEVKTFDFDRGTGFDLANFDAYCNSLLENAYRLDSDYLIFAYQMENARISIKNVWLKKIWELAGGSGTYPIKVQEKKNVIYNLRPVVWYSQRSRFKPFESLEAFLAALNETRYQYPQTRHTNAHWLKKVIKNYEFHTGKRLFVDS
ncbi:MAG: NgoBV family restriction endonuclease [Bacteroidota bacterium]